MLEQWCNNVWLTRKQDLVLHPALWTSLILHLSSYARGTVLIYRVQLVKSGHLLQIAALQQTFQTSTDRLARLQCRAPIASLYATTISQALGEPGGADSSGGAADCCQMYFVNSWALGWSCDPWSAMKCSAWLLLRIILHYYTLYCNITFIIIKYHYSLY